MSYTAIQFETDGPVATITMDRPEKRIALNHALLASLLTKKEVWHTQADMLGWGAQFRYTTSLNSWLRMAPPPADSRGTMRDFMNARKERIARGEATDY